MMLTNTELSNTQTHFNFYSRSVPFRILPISTLVMVFYGTERNQS